jgi:hypothetical protein
MNAFGAWDCLNEALGATHVGVTDNWDLYFPRLELRGIHNMPRVAQLYEELPGVSVSEISEGRTHGPTWCVGRNGAVYEYVLDRAMGGCSSGCREHEAHHFSSEVAGEATPLDVWRSTEGESPAAWYTQLCP